MEIIVSGRAGGKTHQLVEAAVLDKLSGGNPIIVVATENAKDYTEAAVFRCLHQHGVGRPVAERYAKEIVQTPSPLLARGRRTPIRFYVDNLEQVLRRMLGGEVVMVTDNVLVRTPQGKRFEPLETNPHRGLQL